MSSTVCVRDVVWRGLRVDLEEFVLKNLLLMSRILHFCFTIMRQGSKSSIYSLVVVVVGVGWTLY